MTAIQREFGIPLYSTVAGGILLVALFSCNKAKELPLDPPPEDLTETEVIFLGHKGSGSTNYSPLYIENTMPSFINGLKTLDGVEADIQLSLDGTIWIFHDPDFNRENCDTSIQESLILLHDSTIARLERCSGDKRDRIYRLSELIMHWNASGGYFLSLEIKTDFPTVTFAAVGGRTTYLNRLADTLGTMLSGIKHSDKLFVEAEDRSFNDRLKTHPAGMYAKVCKMDYFRFDQQVADARTQGFDGVSCVFSDSTVTAAKVKAARDSGLVVQLWTPNTLEELTTAFAKLPTVIQTDNMNAKAQLKVK